MTKSLLYLIGYRGTGKTTVGRLVAASVGWEFVDADVVLEQNAGQTIKQIFDAEGETAFRDRETANLRTLSQRTNSVIATGGGIILREENRALLSRTGFIVWLKASVAELGKRIAADPVTSERRPNLTVGGAVEIEELVRQREPIYRSCADLEIDTDRRSPEIVAQSILMQWNPSKTCSATPSG